MNWGVCRAHVITCPSLGDPYPSMPDVHYPQNVWFRYVAYFSGYFREDGKSRSLLHFGFLGALFAADVLISCALGVSTFTNGCGEWMSKSVGSALDMPGT